MQNSETPQNVDNKITVNKTETESRDHNFITERSRPSRNLISFRRPVTISIAPWVGETPPAPRVGSSWIPRTRSSRANTTLSSYVMCLHQSSYHTLFAGEERGEKARAEEEQEAKVSLTYEYICSLTCLCGMRQPCKPSRKLLYLFTYSEYWSGQLLWRAKIPTTLLPNSKRLTTWSSTSWHRLHSTQRFGIDRKCTFRCWLHL